MELQQALQLVKQSCAGLMGNLEQHVKVQKALALIESKLQEKSEEKGDSDAKPDGPT
jgi:hypothetical protein